MHVSVFNSHFILLGGSPKGATSSVLSPTVYVSYIIIFIRNSQHHVINLRLPVDPSHQILSYVGDITEG